MGKLGSVAVVLFLLATLGLGCGEKGSLGESCDTSGSLDECEEGTICTMLNGTSTCYQICTDQAQCPTGWNCNGVPSSNIKSCQP
jgi:hypothetical protein